MCPVTFWTILIFPATLNACLDPVFFLTTKIAIYIYHILTFIDQTTAELCNIRDVLIQVYGPLGLILLFRAD